MKKRRRYIVILLILAAGALVAAGYVKQRHEPALQEPAEVSTRATSTPEERPVPAAGPLLSFKPYPVIQGEPLLVSVKNLPEDEQIESISFRNKKLDVFSFNSDPSVLVGIDLRMQTGTYPLVATLSDGEELKKDIKISPREIVVEDLGIPDKLGGNTTEAETELVNSLVEEAAIMNAIPSAPEKLWDGVFRMPLNGKIEITDRYGYSRSTVGTSLSHKGTDFRAAIGTPVYAMNSGVVRFTDFMRNYGNTIVIDHGLGLQTVYMHLSQVLVEDGEEVKKGQLIGKSGDTGYVTGPHLHISVRINYISIDPMKFMEIFG